MAVTLEERVQGLLSRDLALPKSAGVQSSGLEASAVFESVAMSLMLKPRAAFYFEHLARNGLVKAARAEIELLDELRAAVQDLGNISHQVDGAPLLRRARTALLQLEDLPRLSSGQAALTLFENSVQEFLSKHLGKNVRRRGAPGLVRPAAEALAALPKVVAELQAAHADLLDRLYTLSTGVENFLNAPFSALLGTSTVARARRDLEEVLQVVESGGGAAAARELAERLIAGRAAIKTMAAPPDPLAPLFDDIVTTESGAAEARSVPGPFLIDDTPFSVTVNGVTRSFFLFATDGAGLVSKPITFPVVLPAGSGLSLMVDGAPRRVPLTGPISDAAALAAQVQAGGAGLVATNFPGDPTRAYFYHPGAEVLEVTGTLVTEAGGTAGSYAVTTKSAHAELGLELGQRGTRAARAADARDAIAALFPELAATVNDDGSLTLATIETSPGVVLTLQGPPSFGLDGTYRAEARELSASVEDHRGLLQVGDILTLYAGGAPAQRRAAAVRADAAELDSPAPSFRGRARAVSALVGAHDALGARLRVFLKTWSAGAFASDLTTLDRVLASLLSSQSPAHRNAARGVIDSLSSQLTTLLNLLLDPSTMLPTGAAAEERSVVEGILTTLTERNYDRAADLLLRGNLQSLLEMDQDQASYAGNFLRASSEFARAGNVGAPRTTIDVGHT